MTDGTGVAESTANTGGLHEALRNLRRRYVVYYLNRNDGAVPVDDLAEGIAEWEVDGGEVTAAHRKSVYSALHQTHLPKLERVGVVAYDRDDTTVRLTDGANRINFASDVYRSLLWPRRYLAVIGVLAALLVARWAGLPPLAGLPGQAVGALAVVAVGALAAAHYVAVRRWHRRFSRNRPDFIVEFEQW